MSQTTHKSYRIITSPLIYLYFVCPSNSHSSHRIDTRAKTNARLALCNDRSNRLNLEMEKKRRKKRIEEDGKIRVSRLVRSLGECIIRRKGIRSEGEKGEKGRRGRKTFLENGERLSR